MLSPIIIGGMYKFTKIVLCRSWLVGRVKDIKVCSHDPICQIQFTFDVWNVVCYSQNSTALALVDLLPRYIASQQTMKHSSELNLIQQNWIV